VNGQEASSHQGLSTLDGWRGDDHDGDHDGLLRRELRIGSHRGRQHANTCVIVMIESCASGRRMGLDDVSVSDRFTDPALLRRVDVFGRQQPEQCDRECGDDRRQAPGS